MHPGGEGGENTSSQTKRLYVTVVARISKLQLSDSDPRPNRETTNSPTLLSERSMTRAIYVMGNF